MSDTSRIADETPRKENSFMPFDNNYNFHYSSVTLCVSVCVYVYHLFLLDMYGQVFQVVAMNLTGSFREFCWILFLICISKMFITLENAGTM